MTLKRVQTSVHSIDRPDCHPLVTALHLSYAEHRPLRLSPDMIWLLIVYGIYRSMVPCSQSTALGWFALFFP